VQRVLLFVLLTLLYYVGFGATYLFAALFKRRVLWPRAAAPDSAWEAAADYRTDLSTGTEQS